MNTMQNCFTDFRPGKKVRIDLASILIKYLKDCSLDDC